MGRERIYPIGVGKKPLRHRRHADEGDCKGIAAITNTTFASTIAAWTNPAEPANGVQVCWSDQSLRRWRFRLSVGVLWGDILLREAWNV